MNFISFYVLWNYIEKIKGNKADSSHTMTKTLKIHNGLAYTKLHMAAMMVDTT